MRFIIDQDTGDRIVGWLAPDNPNDRSRVRVNVKDRAPVEVEATIMRPDIVALSLHATGMCGFQIDDSMIPGIARCADLEIRDAVTDLLMHRRFDSARHINRKLMFLDASVMPPRKAIDSMRAYFATPYTEVESLTYETLYSMVYQHQSQSLLFAGRPYFMRQITGLKERNFIVAAMLRDPFEDLAERLLFFNFLSRSRNPASVMGYATGLHNLVEFARDLNFEDMKSLAQAIRRATPEQKAAMRDPMTRMLACEPEESAKRHHVTQALDNLSSIDAVGTRERFEEFRGILQDILGVDIFGGASIEPSPLVARLAQNLSRIGVVQYLLEQDLALYSYAAEAFDIGYATAAAAQAAR